MKYVASVLFLFIALAFCVTASAADIKNGGKSEIDTAGRNDGYITVRMTRGTDKRIKVKTTYTQKDNTNIEYTYDLNGNGDAEIFSLQSGSGTYTVQVLQNVDGTRYTVIQTAKVNVTYTSENAPFLIPTQNVNYSDESKVVSKADELCRDAETELDEVNAIYTYIVETLKYDYDKARKITLGEIKQYLPTVDETLDTATGICFDFSSLMAAMLRSRGIPTKLAMGYVAEATPVYHAWNEVYITDVGWVNVRSNVYFDGVDWSRMDSTFAAGNTNGRKTAFIADDENYKKDKEY